MAVTVAQLAAYLGIESRDSDQTLELQTFLDAAHATVEKRAPGAPLAVRNLAVIRLSAYQHDQPYAARGQSFANAFSNSGAGSTLGEWIDRRLADPDAVAATPLVVAVSTFTGYAGWIASGDTADGADFAAGISFENAMWTQPVGGPGHIFFAVPASQGYPDDVTAFLETGHGGAFSQQADAVTFLGASFIVGVRPGRGATFLAQRLQTSVTATPGYLVRSLSR